MGITSPSQDVDCQPHPSHLSSHVPFACLEYRENDNKPQAMLRELNKRTYTNHLKHVISKNVELQIIIH